MTEHAAVLTLSTQRTGATASHHLALKAKLVVIEL
jgi:hypothetical protein